MKSIGKIVMELTSPLENPGPAFIQTLSVLTMLLSVFEKGLVDMGCEVTGKFREGVTEKETVNFRLEYKRGNVQGKMWVLNAFLEVITLDRDAVPMMLDCRILDDEYLMDKMTGIVEMKLECLEIGFEEDAGRREAKLAAFRQKYPGSLKTFEQIPKGALS